MTIEANAIYTVEEACALLRVSRMTLFNIRRAKQLPCLPMRGRIRFRGRQLLDYLDKCERRGRTAPIGKPRGMHEKKPNARR